MKTAIRKSIAASIAVKQAMLDDEICMRSIADATKMMVETYRNGGKVLFCGNGGSAGDAQHIAAELSGRFYYDRAPLYAEALHTNSSYLTAVSNDYGYAEVYARMVRAAGKKGDVLVAISTSGNSENVIRAIEDAQKQAMKVIGMTGMGKGKMHSLCDVLLAVPSSDTPRIQEAHILMGHILCEQVELTLFPTS